MYVMAVAVAVSQAGAAASNGSYRKADGEEGVTREKVQRSTASKEGGGILQPDRANADTLDAGTVLDAGTQQVKHGARAGM
ncbi:uncharacterized protein LAJ45_04529 [Morchella importuna]|uniref:Uncharacterized protein n=1 Tax=Morchella conica CCBAS932 TaxID=1392247 RepID=A0A3N4KUW7_9PEZI|nr:uncharacterized protein LAJ45_04529 [Morchella importuna]KAH8151327.1 hypothetical protein LAJ45_04529 [Morchella importuna]RPB14317.1 hypothetical protein P167DRAFT_65094 [Morchella conica CCBAS932]